MDSEIELLNPVVVVTKALSKVTVQNYDTLEDKSVGILWSFLPWRGFDIFAKRAKEVITQKYHPKEVIDFKSITSTSHGDFESLTRAICQVKGFNFDDLSWMILPGDVNNLEEKDINRLVDDNIEEIKDHLLGKTGTLKVR